MSAGGWDVVEAAALATREDLEAVLTVIAASIRESVPAYAYVSDDQLVSAVRQNVLALLAAATERRTLTVDELKLFELTVEDRARSGIALDQYLLAVTVAEAAVWDELWAHASVPVGPQAMLEALNLRFVNVKAITRVTATAHRRIDLITAREDYERRAVALRSLLRGNLSAEQVRENGARLGIDLSQPYVVVRARARDDSNSDKVQRLLAGPRNHPPHAAFVLWGEDVVGLVSELPRTDAVTAGVAGPVGVDALAAADTDAQVAFSTAWALELSGVFSLSDLGLRAAVHQSAGVGRDLRRKYLAPLHDSGSLGNELLSTVRAYLETGSRRDGAASRMHVHINTVAYRLGRFSELTGADLNDFTTLAELWWLFADLDQRPL